MIEPRLTSDIQVSALKRLAEVGGGFATVLRKGDPTSGAILIIGLVRGANPLLFDRFRSFDGDLVWQKIADNEADVFAKWQKRAARDPDLWVIELDVASIERLNDLTGTRY